MARDSLTILPPWGRVSINGNRGVFRLEEFYTSSVRVVPEEVVLAFRPLVEWTK